jgi:hypothetical protein
VTFGDLKMMLQQDVNRADKETFWYPVWINRALRKIQTDSSFACMRRRAGFTIPASASFVELPENFKELTAELYPVSVVDPAISGALAEFPCQVISREKILASRVSWYANTRAQGQQGTLDGLPVWLEMNDNDRWTLNVIEAPATDLNFVVSYYAYLDDLVEDEDENHLTKNYPDLVENKIKAIAFQSINDPIAGQFEGAAMKLRDEAILEDQRRSRRGRVLRMGG